MKSNLITDIGYLSVNHVGEQLCGDHVEIVSGSDDVQVVVLADGLGSGVKANILSTLTAKMLSTLICSGISIKDAVKSVIETLPICKERHIAYSTFSIVKVVANRFIDIYNFDNPIPFLIRNGELMDLDYEEFMVDNHKIIHTHFEAIPYDTIFMMSDGVIHAGIGTILNFGWEIENVKDYMVSLYNKSYSSRSLATFLTLHVDDMYGNEPGDDTTTAVIRIREKEKMSLLVGPPTNKEDDMKVMDLFFSNEGKHIVCGGTSTKIAATYLDKPVIMDLDYVDKEIPPTASVEGIDLVTEGIITLNKLLEYAKNALTTNKSYFDWCYQQDGASQLARMLFEEATDIDFFVGCAVNPAHQIEDSKINITIKLRVIEELCDCLKKMGKNITIKYY